MKNKNNNKNVENKKHQKKSIENKEYTNQKVLPQSTTLSIDEQIELFADFLIDQFIRQTNEQK